MILWLIAIVLLVSLGIVGYYQGALRAAFSLLGLLLAAVLCVPLSGLIKPLLPVFSVTHPLLIAYIAPFVVYLLVLVAFKVGALVVHKRVETWYKYKGSDTQRSLFERMNSRVGACVGVANACVYLVLISVVSYTLGYFTVQVAKSEGDGITMRLFNNLMDGIRSSGMVRAAAHFSPATEFYYDACDLLADVLRNPLRQSKLSSYPPFLSLSEKPEFQELAKMEFQKFWQGQPTVAEAWSHEKLKPLLQDRELFTNIVSLLEGDLTDLTSYFETGKTPKYEEDKILGRWKLDWQVSYSQSKRAKPDMSLNEMRAIRQLLYGVRDTTFVSTVDKKCVLKVAVPNRPITVQGSWKNNGGGRFGLRMRDPDGKSAEVEARVDGDRMSLAWLSTRFVLERFEK